MFGSDRKNRGWTGTTNNGRPPPFNPYYDKSSRNRTTHRPATPTPTSTHSHGHNLLLLFKHRILPLTILSAILALWFLTPISDIITSLVLLSIPVSSDVQLGLESWYAMQEKDPYKYRLSPQHGHWNVLVKSIGYDIVNSVLLDSHNVNSLCDSIARSTSSTFATTTNDNDNNNNDNDESFFKSAIQFLFQVMSGHNAKEQCQQQALQYNWSFQVIQSKDINAFALPGGIIRVTDTLLQTLHLTKGEIAALLGHEMSHIIYRHGQRQLLKRNVLQTILKALVYDDDDEEEESFGEAVNEVLLVRSASFWGELKFSRMNEYQADHGAWDMLWHGGVFNPKSVQSLLEKLQSLEGVSSGSSSSSSSSSYRSAWDKTHPGTDDRIKVLKKKWNGLNWKDQRRLQALVS